MELQTSRFQRAGHARWGLILRRAVVAPLLAGVATACTPLPTSASEVALSESVNPFAGATLYVDPASDARRQADTWRESDPARASLMERIARQPVAVWKGDWNRDIRRDVDRTVSQMAGAGALPLLVAYNIPQRDCGLYSAGGASDAHAYRAWIDEFARGVGDRSAVVVLEPDALAGMDCLAADRQEERLALLRYAVEQFQGRGIHVYIDAGHARWHGPDEIARRLDAAGIRMAAGFSLNVSNFHPTLENVAYGAEISERASGAHFVIDTSRNGIGVRSADDWCNPVDQGLGNNPTADTGFALVDAFLWIKRPGESDGECNGGPAAGNWWADYALGLAERQPSQLAMDF
jgi:endoglucanase